MPYTVRISDPRCKFSASHFLYEHDKCSRLHGHNYAVNAEVSGELNENFFVVDFYELKSELFAIIEELDHAILIPSLSKNIVVEKFEKGNLNQIKVQFNGKYYEFPSQDVRLLPIQATTAELLSNLIHSKLKKKFQNFKLCIEVAESDGSIARYSE